MEKMSKTKKNIFLPGGIKQVQLFENHIELKGKSILLFGGINKKLIEYFISRETESIEAVVESYEELISARLICSNLKNVRIRMMSFTSLDFNNNSFDLVYSQGTISSLDRRKILLEIKNVLKADGFFCIGEIVNLKKEIPRYMIDIWERAFISPLFIEDVNSFYINNGFKIIESKNISESLKSFYLQCEKLNREKIKTLSSDEQSAYKKLINRFKHEANAYLKLGGDKIMGFVVLIGQINEKE